MTFEAPRELLDPATRDRALRRDPRLRRRPRARARLLAELRAGSEVEEEARLRRHRSRRLPGRDVGLARRPLHRRRGARDRGPAHAHRPGAEVGDGEQEGQRHQAEPEGVPGVRDRGRAPLRRPGRAVVDLERAQPPAVPQAAVRAQEGEVAAHLPQALPRRPARPPRVRQRRRHAAVRRDRAARHPARRRAARVPARRAVPQPLLPPQGPLRADLRRRLRPPRVHDPHRPALPPAGQGRRHDRRPVAALQRAQPRPAGRARSRAGSAST